MAHPPEPYYGKLGKLAPRDDPRTLKLDLYLTPEALPAIPASRAWDKGITSWGALLNDQLGSCTCSAMGHAIQVWTANASTEVTVSDGDVLAAYEAVGHYVPGHPDTDQGAVELDALRYWRSTGIGGHKLGAWADVDPKNHALVRAAIDLFGVVYIGILLPVSAQPQSRPGGTWDVVDPQSPAWGGHAVAVPDYGDTGVTVITWGFIQHCTWAMWDRYVDEVHALIGPEWFGPNAQAPSGFDLAALTRDLAIVSGADPGPPPFQPDPNITALNGWQVHQATYVRDAYSAGNVSSAQQQERVLMQTLKLWQTYYDAQTGQVPELPQAPR